MGGLVGFPATELRRVAALFAPPLLAILLGAFLVIGAGFAPLATVHNAAHDARHSFAFPCH